MDRCLITCVGITIRELRVSNNMSQEKLAEKSNLDRTYISGIERGVRNISLNNLERVMRAFNITTSSFLELLAANILIMERNDESKK